MRVHDRLSAGGPVDARVHRPLRRNRAATFDLGAVEVDQADIPRLNGAVGDTRRRNRDHVAHANAEVTGRANRQSILHEPSTVRHDALFGLLCSLRVETRTTHVPPRYVAPVNLALAKADITRMTDKNQSTDI